MTKVLHILHGTLNGKPHVECTHEAPHALLTTLKVKGVQNVVNTVWVFHPDRWQTGPHCGWVLLDTIPLY